MICPICKNDKRIICACGFCLDCQKIHGHERCIKIYENQRHVKMLEEIIENGSRKRNKKKVNKK